MKIATFSTLALATLLPLFQPGTIAAQGYDAFQNILPPPATVQLTQDQIAELTKELQRLREKFQSVASHPHAADIDIFLKAVDFALEFQEWWDKTPEASYKKAKELLAEAQNRLTALEQGKMPWLEGHGMKVLGFYSDIDDSPQPYAVEIPEGLEWGTDKKSVPVWLWLQGRGDKNTDIHFIHSRLNQKGGNFKSKDTIIVHPFGRYCNGYKSAGETDVLECRLHALQRFNGDPQRVALMGFSMGGAGAWHMGAHYADQWAAVHPGAGFADVKHYLKLTPEKMPSAVEQKLWGIYDVPNYALNFFNVPTILYSGEQDKQKETGDYMESVLKSYGYQAPHLIGKGVGHKYVPEVRDEIGDWITKTLSQPKPLVPNKVWLQSRSARYARQFWVQVVKVKSQWDDTRVIAEMLDQGRIKVETRNVEILILDPVATKIEGKEVHIDGQKVEGKLTGLFRKKKGKWVTASGLSSMPRKPGGTTIEDAFLHRFVVVLPDRPGRHPETDAWYEKESQHFIRRWKQLMRGTPIVAKASQAGASKATSENLILFGDDVSNVAIASRMKDLPVKWDSAGVQFKGKKFDGKHHVFSMITPEVPFNPATRMIVLNSGLTFREGHDRTNSLQNPKLPDWAVIDIREAPTPTSIGKIVDQGFFDENWK